MEISAKMIKELKEKTGAGLVDCKSTLQETGGDIDKAVEILRKKGLAKAQKKEGREANEGLIVIKENGKKGVVVKVNCETDFVAATDDFKNFTKEVLEKIFNDNLKFSKELPEAVETLRKNIIAKLGENIQVPDWQFLDAKGKIYQYIHLDKVGLLMDYSYSGSESDDFAQLVKNIAMQITAMNPLAIDVDSFPADKLAELKEQFAAEAKETGKPEKIWEKIIQGKLDKYFGDVVLLEQVFILDEEKKIKDIINEFVKKNGTEFKINSFVRISL